jgi:competence protein ComGC
MNIILIIIIFILLLKSFNNKNINKENFTIDSNTRDAINEAVQQALQDRAYQLTKDDLKTLINERYQADLTAIRNLADIAYKLQRNTLEIPGDLTVRGNLYYKGNFSKI